MSVAKFSLFSLALLVTSAQAIPPGAVGLPAPRPGGPTMGMPVRPGIRPPVVGLPIRPPVRPPVVGMPIRPPVRPPVVGLPVHPIHPPIVGMPIRPPVRNLELDCRADRHGNRSGFSRVKLDLERTGRNTFHVEGFVRYFDGAEARIRTIASGEVSRQLVHLGLVRVGQIDLHSDGHHHGHSDLQGEISLFGRRDINGMNCELDRD